jgi:hypothetical protein|tara:strand:- start:341 stop:496 length:156 start_codon:yes stop_codon:yes gene_type:complete
MLYEPDCSIKKILSFIESDLKLSSIKAEVDCDANIGEAEIKYLKYLLKRKI